MRISIEQRDRLNWLFIKKKVSRAEVAKKLKFTEVYFTKGLLTDRKMHVRLWEKIVFILNKKYEYSNLLNFTFEREKGKVHFDLLNVVDKLIPTTLEKYELLGYWFRNLAGNETENFDEYWRRVTESEIKEFVLNYLNNRK